MRAPPELSRLQAFLAGALRRDDPIEADPAVAAAAAEHVAGNDRVPPAEQADIYRQQFWFRHLDALAEDYPATRVLVGDDVFDALVHAYLAAHPPRTPSLRDLGADIVSFAARWPGFPEDRRAAALDLLRYEHAFIDLFDGADPPPLDGAKLQALGPDDWERARIVLHPLLARLRLSFPVHRYRLAAMDTGEGAEPPPPPEPGAVCLLLYRRDAILYEEVEPEAIALLDALAAGEPLAVACEHVAATLPADAAEALAGKVGGWFQHWTAVGWVVDVQV